MLREATSIGEGASVGCSLCDWEVGVGGFGDVAKCALFETLLLNAGQPLQPSAPPVPLHRPPPGHDPVGV